MLVLVWLVASTAGIFSRLAKDYRHPPSCFPVPEEQAVVCMSWAPFLAEFVEVNRIPFPKQPPLERTTHNDEATTRVEAKGQGAG